MTQTAVEWLFLMMNNPNRDQEFANKLLEKAKEMEAYNRKMEAMKYYLKGFEDAELTEKQPVTHEQTMRDAETHFHLIYPLKNEKSETLIDWWEVPDGFNWVAMDKSGKWYSHKSCPYLSTYEWFSSLETEYIEPSIIKNAPTDWKLCKFKRP